MTLSTRFTRMFGMRHPIALAPMGGSAGGELAAAVSRGGGLGLVGGGSGERAWLARELPIAAGSGLPWGVGFLCWAAEVAAVERALEYGPAAVMLSFGDPAPFVGLVRDAGAAVIVQVTDVAEARRAVAVGADVIVAQGTESGGHGARRGRSTLPFVPVVADLAAPIPVLAVGGIADGRGVAAALALGAEGALIGTRFQATAEALADPAAVESIVRGSGQDTERTSVLDIARESPWPRTYTARTLGHPYLDRWRGREAELAADPGARAEYRADVARGAARCRCFRCGPVRPSISSPMCRARRTSSARWPRRRKKPSAGRGGPASTDGAEPRPGVPGPGFADRWQDTCGRGECRQARTARAAGAAGSPSAADSPYAAGNRTRTAARHGRGGKGAIR
ncbi:nitronate monooxygenase [Actinacidiphila alni]|nr:nitronate monooxygenase [Actinacidiphila alni]